MRVRGGAGTRAVAAVALVGALALVAGCTGSDEGHADGSPADDGPVVTATPDPAATADPGAVPAAGHLAGPPEGAVVDYQLGGGYAPADGIGGVVRDVTDDPEPGMWSGCYVNGFQTQPAERDTWLTEHPDLLLRDDAGDPVIDPGWPDELLLDTTTPEQRAAIAEVVGAQVEQCAERGFDAVELDNLDSWTRSDGRLTEDGAVDLAARLVAVGHAAGLAVGQKNAPDLGTRGRDEAGFDFAVSEECLQYDECAAYTDVYGAAVIDIEYEVDDWTAACADPQRPPSTVLRDRDLRTPADEAYVLETC